MRSKLPHLLAEHLLGAGLSPPQHLGTLMKHEKRYEVVKRWRHEDPEKFV